MRSAREAGGQGREEQAGGTADEADDLQEYPAHDVGEHDGEQDADDEQGRDHGRTLRGSDVVRDQIGHAARMVRVGAEGCREDRRREDADAVGAKVLQEPGNRCEDRRPSIGLVEQRGVALLASFSRACITAWREIDLRGILRLADQELLGRLFSLLDLAAREQPVGALDDIEASDRDEQGRDDGRGVHPSPRAYFGEGREDEITDGGACERADRLERECAEHEPPASRARNAFRDDHVCRRVVAAQRDAQSEQAENQEIEVAREDEADQERDEDDHLDDEHGLASEPIGHASERYRADQDAEEACRADDAVLGGADIEFGRQQRKRHAGHEDDEALKEFARGRQRPDEPLHAGHRR